MKKIEIYTADNCRFCQETKALLKSYGVKFSEINVTNDPDRKELTNRTFGIRAVPQIFVNDEYLGDATFIKSLENSGRLSHKLGLE